MERWYVYCKKADFAALARQFNISPMLARIIRNRDIIGEDAIDRYLNGGLKDLHDPFLMKGMREGVQLITETIRYGGKIRIVGDYDVDGVCSSYILKTFLEKAGGRADVRLPDRVREGYGLNESMVEEAARDGISLLLTCDNGISAVQAVDRAAQLGICVIITDHHEPPQELPRAQAIIDPKQEGCAYPFKELCGGAVAYQFVRALNIALRLHEEELLDELLQFAGMATIADIVPLLDENRIFASEGIKRLRHTNNIGLNALICARGLEKELISAANVGFVLGPCINSAGRLKHAKLAYDLLETGDPLKARILARELSELNEERKRLTMSQGGLAIQALKDKEANGEELPKVLVSFLPDAHESVAGIIAGRMKDEFHRPAIVITRSEEGLKGSGRSTDAYNLIESLRRNEELFTRCGGHAKACGFSLRSGENEEEAVVQLSDILNRSCSLKEKDLEKSVWIDMQLPFKYITDAFTRELEKLEPFGLANEKPVFAERNVAVLSSSIVGKNRNVLKLYLEDSQGTQVEGILFGSEESIRQQAQELAGHSKISLLYYPGINEFRGQRTPQALIQSLQITE